LQLAASEDNRWGRRARNQVTRQRHVDPPAVYVFGPPPYRAWFAKSLTTL
jgi:hypothetical protein